MSRRASRGRASVRNALAKTPKTIKPEDAFAYKSADALAEFSKYADPESLKRLDRVRATDEDAKSRWLSKVMTRADTFAAIDMWSKSHLLTMAHRLDLCEAYIEYLEKPALVRWSIRAKAWAVWIGAHLITTMRKITGRKANARPGSSGVEDHEGGRGDDK